MSRVRPSSPKLASGQTPKGKTAVRTVPQFALYGELAPEEQDFLHIEEVRSRSRLYHWEIDAHVHQGLYQVLWLRSGHAELRLDGQRDAMAAPAVIVVPPGVIHGFRFEPETDGLVLTLNARRLVEGEFQAVGAAFRRLFAQPGAMALVAGDPAVQRLDALMGELLAEFAQPAEADSPVLGWLARAVVWRLGRLHRADAAPDASDTHTGSAAQFTRFLLLVEAHFLEHWSVAQYASRLGLSSPRLNRMVHSRTGRSALELVHERLTREACRRLVYIAAPVANLAAELGFEDPAYFSRFFKRRMGQTPHRWRQTRREG